MAWWKWDFTLLQGIIAQKNRLVNSFLKIFFAFEKKARVLSFFSARNFRQVPTRSSLKGGFSFIQNNQKPLRHFVVKIYSLFFCTNFSTKNRTTWIFTNSRLWCIIKSRVRMPIRVGYLLFPAQQLFFREISIL
jgi:hypothetical protein